MSLDHAFADVFSTRSTDGQLSGGFGGFSFLLGGGKGTKANTKTAFTISAFYNGVDQLSNDMAKLPKFVFKKDGENREKDADHPVNYLISQRPNSLMTSFDFWKIIEISAIVKGNGYAEIVRNSYTGDPEELYFLEEPDVEVSIKNRKLYYKYKGRPIASSDILHFRGFSFDGLMGIGIVTFAAKQLGITIDSQTYQQEVYKDRGLGYGVIESDLKVDKGNKKLIEEGFATKMAGESKFKVPMLDEGMKYKSISITPGEAQFLETNKAGVLEVCRWLNIAPHKLKDISSGTYANIYQQSIEHVQDSMMPRVISREQELNYKLFTKKESKTLYTKFNLAVLLRGDLEMKQKFYTAMVYAGIYTRNEVRALEDMNPIEGLDEILQPVNMQALAMANKLNEDQGNGK
ncbi:phage portal protein [Flavobacterium oncorhynchi]|uniref:Phage portal protein n=1 Tax=Flavobacterium oncorhynchi TaxID=728056 RepID=A0A226I5F2_9FLAO|nr:phage portal protein [Flavobacterium oncorhynchi]OXB01740.1 phage portal protein [Flavobacterium oncorhynchi]